MPSVGAIVTDDDAMGNDVAATMGLVVGFVVGAAVVGSDVDDVGADVDDVDDVGTDVDDVGTDVDDVGAVDVDDATASSNPSNLFLSDS